MNIDIQARRFTLTDALREHTRRRLGFAFGTRQVDRVCSVIQASKRIANGAADPSDPVCFPPIQQ